MSEEKRTEVLLAKEREREKTRQQRGEDIAYTINHAISCGITDIFVQPAAAALVTSADAKGQLPSWLRWTKHIFEDHDHGSSKHVHDDNCNHGRSLKYKGKDYATPKTTIAAETSAHGGSFMHNVGHWFAGEVIGDVGAVPLTIGVQRMFPNLMTGIQHSLEPIAGPAFKSGATHAAEAWGRRNGYLSDSEQVKEKTQTLYEHEISHLPQAVIWNVFSFPINIGAQMVMFHKTWKDLPTMAVAKTFGAVFSNGVLIGGRAWTPDHASDLDAWNSKNIVVPTTKFISGLLGVDAETVDRVTNQQSESHASRVKKSREEKEMDEGPAV